MRTGARGVVSYFLLGSNFKEAAARFPDRSGNGSQAHEREKGMGRTRVAAEIATGIAQDDFDGVEWSADFRERGATPRMPLVDAFSQPMSGPASTGARTGMRERWHPFQRLIDPPKFKTLSSFRKIRRISHYSSETSVQRVV
jgi:hypothetical protein